jgi:hypothetical protein
MVAAFVAAISLLFARGAVREAARQMALSREALRAQTYISVTSYEREIKFSRKMDAIRALGHRMAHTATTREQQALTKPSYDALTPERKGALTLEQWALAKTTYGALTPGQKDDIRAVVDFLNHVAHLISYGYVSTVHLLLLYEPSIADCQKVLIELMRWLDQFRDEAGSPIFYLHFASLCHPDKRKELWRNGRTQFTGDLLIRPDFL